ncbi:MAG: RsfS/YbeB/iojap family protein, partial [Bacteroidaceae bacterium]|nr:RsfS/YbeB/iojap family protein [Bacteroidaceae bacterium]
EKPRAIDGLRNSIWVALDYTDVMVHVFVPDARQFYDIDNLWDDADIQDIPDLD